MLLLVINMSLLYDVEPGKIPETVNVIIEIPKGSQNKYEYDKKNKMLKLDRVLFSPMHYPGDYGFIPQTLGEDNDPLDALVLVTYPTFPLTLIEARPIGLLKMVDKGEPDDKILCVPVDDPRFNEVKDISGIQKHVLNEIAHFFEVYKALEGKKVDIKGWHGVKKAQEIIKQCVERFKQ